MSQNKGGKQTYTKRQYNNNNSEGDNLPRDVEKKVRQIQEMFGDWKKTEIQRCLEENNYDVQLVVQKKVDGKEDWTTVEKKEIRTQKSTRGGRGRGRGGSRGGSRTGSSPSGTRSTSTTQQPASSPTTDKPNKKKPSKQDKTTSSEVRNFSAPEDQVVEEEPKQTQPQQAKVLSYSEAAAAFKKKEDEEKKKIEEEKKLLEQQAKDQKEKAKTERNQQRKSKKGDKKAPKEEVKEPVQEPIQIQQQVVQESVVEEEVPEEELANEEVEQQVEEQVEIQQPSQPIQQQQQPASQSNYQTSFEQRPTQQEEQPQLQMPTGIPYNTTQNIQFGTLDLGSQPLPKSQPTSSVNQPNAQTNPQMQNGQFWSDPKMHHNYGIPYIPNHQYPYHPQYYPYIYQYYQPQGAQGVNTNKNFNQGFGYNQEGFGMYNQATGSEDAEQHQQDANYPFVQQPYFFMYPQSQQMQMDNKHKSESPQNEAKVNPYPAYLPGYQSQYPQSGYVFGHPNQIVYPAYPSGNPTNNTTHQQNQKKW